MKKSKKHKLARLLSGQARMTRLETEEVLERVLQATPTRQRRVWLVWALPALASAALLLLLLDLREKRPPEFQDRGDQPAPSLEVYCLGPQGRTTGCRGGMKVVFEPHTTQPFSYLAAFSRRGDGTVLWYFPASATATSIPFVAERPLDQAVVLGREHAPGTYELFALFSREPLSQEQMKQVIASGVTDSRQILIRQTLVIQ